MKSNKPKSVIRNLVAFRMDWVETEDLDAVEYSFVCNT